MLQPKLKTILHYILLLLLILMEALEQVEAVKRSDFKTCNDAKFCSRQRNYAINRKNNTLEFSYFIDKETILFDNAKLLAEIINGENNVRLNMELSILENEQIRLRVMEKDGLKKRYDEVKKHVLVKEPALEKKENLKGEFVGNDYWILNNDFKVKLQLNPILIELFIKDDKLMEFNSKQFFNFEHYRNKENKKNKENKENKESDNENELEDDLGLWEETFNGFTDSKPNGPSSIGFDIQLNKFQHVYGLPQHATNLSLKSTDGKEGNYNEPYRLYNLDVFEYEIDNPMALYGSIPFLLAHNKDYSASIFWLNSAEMWVDIEKDDNKNTLTHWISESGLLDIFLSITSKHPNQILNNYSKLTGFSALPNSFSIAYHQCRWNYLNDKDVVEVDNNFDKYDIPYDVIWLDIEHTINKKYFTWDNVKFPNPIELQNKISKKHRKMVTIIDPHIKREDDYYIYKQGQQYGYFVKNKDGSDFDGWCWPGSSSWIDYTQPEACTWWSSQFSFNKYEGSTKDLYVWNDMNEPSVFNGPEITMAKDLLHANNVEHRELHNMFGLLFHRSTALGLVQRESPAKRPFVLSRAFFPGTQRVGAIWTGDNGATWEYLRISTPMLLSIGLSGITFSGADVGGFFGNPEPELLVRWYQAGAFQPFFRAHAHIDTKRREPWLFGEPYTSQIRQAIRNRYQLLPFWYTLFFEASFSGVPTMRPMFLEFPNEERLFSMDDQYMVGSALLVKPVVEPSIKELEIDLPGDEVWYNYFDYTKYNPGKHIVPAPADTIPVYLRSGFIVSQRQRVRRSSSLMQRDPITLIVTLNSKGQSKGTLYLDDGESYAYLKSNFHYRQFEFNNQTLSNRPVPTSNYQLINPLPFEPSIANEPNELFYENIEIERIVILPILKKPEKVVCLKCGRKVDFYFEKEVLTVKLPKLQIGKDWDLALVY